jgi:hypothetical protein
MHISTVFQNVTHLAVDVFKIKQFLKWGIHALEI